MLTTEDIELENDRTNISDDLLFYHYFFSLLSKVDVSVLKENTIETISQKLADLSYETYSHFNDFVKCHVEHRRI